MGSWKNHVRARLQERDLNEKVPFLGVYTSCTQILHLVLLDVMMHAMMLTWTICLFSVLQLEERYEARKHILDDILSERYDGFAEALLLFWRLKAVFKNHIQYFVLFFFSSVNLSPVELRLGEVNSSNGNWGRANTWLKRSVIITLLNYAVGLHNAMYVPLQHGTNNQKPIIINPAYFV